MKVLGASMNPTTLAVGAGAVLLAPIILPFVAGILRPLAKAAIKGGLIAYEKAKVMSSEAVESLEDLAAEAKAEVSSQLDAEAEAEAAKPKKAAAKEAKA
jgi:hypothetical protein